MFERLQSHRRTYPSSRRQSSVCSLKNLFACILGLAIVFMVWVTININQEIRAAHSGAGVHQERQVEDRPLAAKDSVVQSEREPDGFTTDLPPMSGRDPFEKISTHSKSPGTGEYAVRALPPTTKISMFKAGRLKWTHDVADDLIPGHIVTQISIGEWYQSKENGLLVAVYWRQDDDRAWRTVFEAESGTILALDPVP